MIVIFTILIILNDKDLCVMDMLTLSKELVNLSDGAFTGEGYQDSLILKNYLYSMFINFKSTDQQVKMLC